MKVYPLENLTLKKANYFFPLTNKFYRLPSKACKGYVPPMPVTDETVTSNSPSDEAGKIS